MSYVNEPFEELDVMNYFMFNQLVTNPKTQDGFSRCMIWNLLGIEMSKNIHIQGENVIFPSDPQKRGVRLDVQIDEYNEASLLTGIYDIEPHRNKESDYPRKTRFTQANIDKNLLSSGEKYFSVMPELHIINITNYDPFGYDLMQYTFKMTCKECPDLVYNDGVIIHYFNTTGTKGGTKELKAFLLFLEESKKEYATTPATKEVSEYVEEIKHNAQIGGDYMTFGDLMDRVAADTAAEKDAIIAEKDAAFAKMVSEKDAENAKLRKEIDKLKKLVPNGKQTF